MTDIFLPGSDEQLNKFLKFVPVADKQILVIGAGSVPLASAMLDNGAKSVIIIVDNNDTLLQERFSLKRKDIQIRLMEYHNTDFRDSLFDIIYTQGSITTVKRNKIIKEIQRILKPEGIICTGEVVSLKDEIPQYVNDLWELSLLKPLNYYKIDDDYKEKGFNILHRYDLSFTLEDFYIDAKKGLQKTMSELTEDEKRYYKKLLNKISHESNAYLKLGGDKVIGFVMIIADRKSE